MKFKQAFIYFISFFCLSLMFTACYYLSYKNALKDFNESAVERNNELIVSLENQGFIQSGGKEVAEGNGTNGQETAQNNENSDTNSTDLAVDAMTEDTVLPTTEYTLRTYDVKTGNTEEEVLPTPSYLIGLTREEVIDYLSNYMQDLPLNEFQKGLMSFELVSFSTDSIVLKKTYNADEIQYKYYLKGQDGYIVAYYGDQKTVFDYTGISLDGLSDTDKEKLEAGIFVKDLDELYALLENYSS